MITYYKAVAENFCCKTKPTISWLAIADMRLVSMFLPNIFQNIKEGIIIHLETGLTQQACYPISVSLSYKA